MIDQAHIPSPSLPGSKADGVASEHLCNDKVSFPYLSSIVLNDFVQQKRGQQLVVISGVAGPGIDAIKPALRKSCASHSYT